MKFFLQANGERANIQPECTVLWDELHICEGTINDDKPRAKLTYLYLKQQPQCPNKVWKIEPTQKCQKAQLQ